MLRSFHTMATASDMSVTVVATSQMLQTVFSSARVDLGTAYDAETTFLGRSAIVGKRKMVNIVYVPPPAAVRTSTAIAIVKGRLRDLLHSQS